MGFSEIHFVNAHAPVSFVVFFSAVHTFGKSSKQEAVLKTLLMILRATGHQHSHSQPPINIEVVVNVHAAQTTTSEREARFGIITKPKRKLITSETEPAANIQEAVVTKHYQSQQQLQNSPQPQHSSRLIRDDDEIITRVNITTHTTHPQHR